MAIVVVKLICEFSHASFKDQEEKQTRLSCPPPPARLWGFFDFSHIFARSIRSGFVAVIPVWAAEMSEKRAPPLSEIGAIRRRLFLYLAL